ncbi:MAG: endo-1,3-1,4-beta-glycanase ExoK [Flavobacteriales bacterium]|jgi:endo-1,3-1,4-beta-glycanase ExoK
MNKNKELRHKYKNVIRGCIATAILTSAAISSANTPYNGNAFSIPGVIESEQFDLGGQGSAYNDFSSENTGGQFRSESVDIEAASSGGYNIGWFEPGEWLEYTVIVNTSGSYNITSNISSPSNGIIQYQFTGSTNINSAEVSFGGTGGWQNWSNSPSTVVDLNAGEHILRVLQVGGGYNLNSVQLSSPSGSTPEAYAGYTGQYAGFSLKLDERFDSFDESVWRKGDGAVGGESDCRFQDNGVQNENGILSLIIRNEYVASSWSDDHQSWKGAYNYSCGELRTRPDKRIRYGRIETRMKAPAREIASGYISSLFTYRNEGSPREWEEIDVELEGGRPDKFQANLIYGFNANDWNATRQWGAWEHKIDVGPVDAWRVFAIEWTPNSIKWFIDGVHVKTLSQDQLDCNPSCQYPQINPTPIPDDLTELMMNFWIPNDSIQNFFGGNKSNNAYPMTTQYDWVRIYQLDSEPLQNW